MTDFPMDIMIFNKIVEVFNKTRSYVLLLFPLAFFIRIAFGFILLKGPESFTDILKDSLFLFLGLFFFTDILKLTLQIPYFVSQELSFGNWRNINLGGGLFIKPLQRIVDWIGIVSYWISFGLYVVIVSILGFFAGYILFIGTMFRTYGLLKVFFILLFVVSLWPLLWHSINFAVYTIAVSDNAFANNVIVGGASLAKVFVPLWLLSKTSKIPFSQNFKKISYFGGSLAGAAGSGAYSVIRDKTENIFQREEIRDEERENEEGEINISQTDEINHSENYGDTSHSEEIYNEPENFSIREGESKEAGQDEIPISTEEDNLKSLTTKEETPEKEESLLSQANTFKEENHASQENQVVNENHVTQESHMESHAQTHVQNQVQRQTSKEFQDHSQVIRETTLSNPEESHNTSVLNETEPQKQEPVPEAPTHEKSSLQFNEEMRRKDLVEESGENIAPRYKQNQEGEDEL